MTPKQRGLGRGLDALFGDEEETHLAHQEEIEVAPSASRKLVGIEQLDANPDQPRTHFDADALTALATSIKRHGLLQPILVRPHRSAPERFEIIAGERRWRAAQKAQLHEVPIVIRDLNDDETFQLALIENLQREDLNAIEEARGYQRLVDEFGHSPESVGDVVGKSRSHVANLIRLLNLPESVQTMVVNGDISAGHARALLNSDNPTLLAQEVISKGLSVRQTEKLAKENAGEKFRVHKPKANGSTKDANIMDLEKQLSDKLGIDVVLSMKDGQKGVLNLSFTTLDQLDYLIAQLSK